MTFSKTVLFIITTNLRNKDGMAALYIRDINGAWQSLKATVPDRRA